MAHKEEKPEKHAEPKAEKHPEAKKAKESALVEVEFPAGKDDKGEIIYRVQEVSREIAEAQLKLPETREEIKEGEPVKLRNSAYRGARLKN